MKPIRALIVDDHALVAEGLERVLHLDGRVEVVGSARTLQEAKVLLLRVTPDVILLDLRLPDSQGAATIAAVKQCCPASKIVVLTGYDWADEDKAREMGVEAFLRKEMASKIIAQTVADLFPAEPAGDLSEQRLTARELEVARLVAEGMTNTEIGRALYISPETVKTHLAHIMHKLKLGGRVDIVRWWDRRLGPPPSSA
jgi:DNA-binding NarL/FixJ family response regulator